MTALPLFGASYFTEQFINGAGLVLSNNTTLTYGQSSVLVLSPVAQGGTYSGQSQSIFGSLSTYQYMPTIVSNSVSGFQPGDQYWTNLTTAYVPYTSSSNSGVPTIVGGYVQNTNVTQPMAWVDVPGFSDLYADAGQGCISVTIKPATLQLVGVTTAKHITDSTNTVTLTFVPVFNNTNAVTYSAVGGTSALEAVDKITLVAIAGGATGVTLKTNLPSAFITGARRIRLLTAVSSNVSSGVPLTIESITLSGWK